MIFGWDRVHLLAKVWPFHRSAEYGVLSFLHVKTSLLAAEMILNLLKVYNCLCLLVLSEG